MHNELSDFDVEEVKKLAREKLGDCRKSYDIIGKQVLSILGLYARVIYYPLGKNAPWGFTRISGSVNETGKGKPFVAINTSIPLSCQIFAAAHELYHIWFETSPDIIPGNLLDEEGIAANEKKANRFAAEFLVDEMILRQEIDTYGITQISIKEVLQLAVLFTVPYKAMVKRLHETGYIDDNERAEMLAETDESISRCRKKYALLDEEGDDKIAMDNLVELSTNAYEADLLSYEKLEYLLKLCCLKPEELGIVPESAGSFPSDEELDEIMEEDE